MIFVASIKSQPPFIAVILEMSTPNNLEQRGKLEEFPAAQLLKEAAAASLSGTFHFVSGAQKIAVYLSEGHIIYAASNARGHRLALKLRQWNALAEKDVLELIDLPEPELAARLLETQKISAETLESYRARLVAEIITAAIQWATGEWNFNPLVRVREEMHVRIELPQMLIEAVRQMPVDFLQKRFISDQSTFALPLAPALEIALSPEEGYVLSRFDGAMTAETTAMMCGLPAEKTGSVLYSLWLGGMLDRFNYQKAFDESTIALIQSAKIALSQKNPIPPVKIANGKPAEVSPVVEVNQKIIEEKSFDVPPMPVLSEKEQVQAFLLRVETAKTFYHILDVDNSTDAGEIKKSYFKLAKQFHPDKFHSIGGETHSRLQNAFTKLAQAYETLRDTKNRELYDFKLRKQAAIAGDKTEVSQFTPEEIYQSGVKELQGGNYNQAVAYLQRAVQLAPNVAEYQARLGQALAVNPKFRHQAEEKMQMAIRLDERNADWRLLLAEYYIAIGLNKRAEGELNRLLSIYPNHSAAAQMFASLR